MICPTFPALNSGVVLVWTMWNGQYLTSFDLHRFHMVQPNRMRQTVPIDLKTSGPPAFFFGWLLIWGVACPGDCSLMLVSSVTGHRIVGCWASLFPLPSLQASLQATTLIVMFHMGPWMVPARGGWSPSLTAAVQWRRGGLWCQWAWFAVLNPQLFSWMTLDLSS